jgi:hypothetical protein
MGLMIGTFIVSANLTTCAVYFTTPHLRAEAKAKP